MSGSPIVLAVCSSWNMRSQVVHLALSMSKAVCQTRFEQTEYILHAVYEPAAHGLVPLRSARVPGLAATSFYPTLPESVQAAACLYCAACMRSTETTSRKIKLVGFDWTC